MPDEVLAIFHALTVRFGGDLLFFNVDLAHHPAGDDLSLGADGGHHWGELVGDTPPTPATKFIAGLLVPFIVLDL